MNRRRLFLAAKILGLVVILTSVAPMDAIPCSAPDDTDAVAAVLTASVVADPDDVPALGRIYRFVMTPFTAMKRAVFVPCCQGGNDCIRDGCFLLSDCDNNSDCGGGLAPLGEEVPKLDALP